MAVMEHPDMPKSLLGIQGLNVWNLLLGNVLAAWLAARRREGLRWDLPAHVTWSLLLYVIVVMVAFARVVLVRDRLSDEFTTAGLVSEYLINCLKWIIPGLLLFDGCRDRTRFIWGLTCTLGIYLLLAIQVIKWMPLSQGLS